MARRGIAAPVTLGVGIDAKDVTRHVLGIGQAGLGLPDRDDDAKTDATTLRLKAAYRLHAATLLKAAGTDDDARLGAAVDALKAFEGELAYLANHGAPQLFFHVTTAHALLRHKGVSIGKRDYMGSY